MNKCVKCYKQFKNKHDLLRHLKRKFPCKDHNIIIDDNYMQKVEELKIKNDKLELDVEQLKKEVERLSNENKVTIVNNVNNTTYPYPGSYYYSYYNPGTSTTTMNTIK